MDLNMDLKKVVKVVPLKLYPSQLGDVKKGINENLKSKLMKYNTEYKGVPVGFSKIKLTSQRAVIHEDSPIIHAYAKVTFTIFRPKVGDVLEGEVNKVTVDHIGVVVLGRFNASVSRSDLPSGYTYREDLGAYVLDDVDSVNIKVGSKIKIVVKTIEASHGVINLNSTLY
eukprot:m.18450 g.18450  ORF g.18450 m.18450 type:complete len:170 (-) comp8318_c0_seq1:51-560(-)